MELDSLLDIKRNFLHSFLIKLFSELYDKHTCEFFIHGRGRITLNELSFLRTLGLPLGSDPVVFVVDSKIEDVHGPIVFFQYGCTPTRTRVFNIPTTM
jgi:hypothetical protein